MDSFMFNVLPWRILFIVDELDSRYQIAAGWDEAEIMNNWAYLEKESCPQVFKFFLLKQLLSKIE